jgi:hypothetical protein
VSVGSIGAVGVTTLQTLWPAALRGSVQAGEEGWGVREGPDAGRSVFVRVSRMDRGNTRKDSMPVRIG